MSYTGYPHFNLRKIAYGQVVRNFLPYLEGTEQTVNCKAYHTISFDYYIANIDSSFILLIYSTTLTGESGSEADECEKKYI